MKARIRKKVLKRYYPQIHMITMLSFVQGVDPSKVKVGPGDGIDQNIVRNFGRIRRLVAIASRKYRNTLKINEITKKVISRKMEH